MATGQPVRHELRTYADRPIAAADQDLYGFLSYADAFALLLNDANTATPLTVAISGPWGSGKTSLAQLLEVRLKVATVPGVYASTDLVQVLRDGIPLAPVLPRLVRFEPAEQEDVAAG